MRTVPKVTSLPDELDGMSAIVAGTLSETGNLLQANSGVLRIVPAGIQSDSAGDLSHWFIQPGYPTLKAAALRAPEGVYSGLLTVGIAQGITGTLKAQFWQVCDQWSLLAEHDIDELERVCATVLELNQEYAFAQAKLAQANFSLQQRESQILAVALSDPLTGVGNRRRLEQALPLELSRAQRSGEKLCAIMCDIDHFKRVNDKYGHAVGDKVLVAIGHVLQSQMRPTDIVTRFGGEEFVVLIPNTDITQAMEAAERIRSIIEALHIEPVAEPISASFGVAELQDGEQATSLLKRIDTALYAAKLAGRNRVGRG